MPDIMQHEHVWIIQVFIIVFMTLLVDLVQKDLLQRLLQQTKKTRNMWDDALFQALKKPLRLLIWIIGFGCALRIVDMENSSTLIGIVDSTQRLGILLTLLWFLTRFITESERQVVTQKEASGEKVDRTTINAVAKLLRASVYITGSLVILQSMGYSISGVLAFGGIGGIAVGFAARDLLANFFGGLMVYLDRPFSVGDWVRSPDREIEGIVENVGWRLTRIRTFDKRPLYVPNSLFNTILLENPSRMTNRRIYETICVRYQDADKLQTIVEHVRNMLRTHEEIDQNTTLIVNLNEFAPSSLDFFVYTFTRTTNWIRFHEIKQDVMLKILAIIEEQGAECAFPSSSVYLPDPIQLNTDLTGSTTSS